MTLLHVVDAFTSEPFAGNPAAVCILGAAADERWMQQVAREMNLAETAFVHPAEGGWSLRWFTPAVEVDLCGHATLASARVLWETGHLPGDAAATFHTRSGTLTCRREEDWITMDFPASSLTPDESVRADLETALGVPLSAVMRTDFDFLTEIADASTLRSLRPDMNRLAALPVRGIIVTSRSDDPAFDFLSRFFGPACEVNEDPVTGSAHCSLGPYWQAKLGKADFTAYQASARGGVVKVGVRGDRVLLHGQTVLMSRVELLH